MDASSDSEDSLHGIVGFHRPTGQGATSKQRTSSSGSAAPPTTSLSATTTTAVTTAAKTSVSSKGIKSKAPLSKVAVAPVKKSQTANSDTKTPANRSKRKQPPVGSDSDDDATRDPVSEGLLTKRKKAKKKKAKSARETSVDDIASATVETASVDEEKQDEEKSTGGGHTGSFATTTIAATTTATSEADGLMESALLAKLRGGGARFDDTTEAGAAVAAAPVGAVTGKQSKGSKDKRKIKGASQPQQQQHHHAYQKKRVVYGAPKYKSLGCPEFANDLEQHVREWAHERGVAVLTMTNRDGSRFGSVKFEFGLVDDGHDQDDDATAVARARWAQLCGQFQMKESDFGRVISIDDVPYTLRDIKDNAHSRAPIMLLGESGKKKWMNEYDVIMRLGSARAQDAVRRIAVL